jgi:hypothetical protein
MPGVSLSDFGASFIHYLPGVVRILNNTSKARLLPKGNLKWNGEYVQKTVHVKRNAAIAFPQDGGAIPPAGKQSYVPMKLARKFMVGSVKVTDGLLENADTTENAAITVVESELRGMLDGIRKLENFYFTRDGTGIVATIGATVSDVVGPPYNITVSDGRALWDDAFYEILVATTLASNGTFQVSSIARAFTAAGEVTVTTAGPVAANGQATGDFIVWKGSSASVSSNYNCVPMGLDGMIDDNTGTFQSINNTTYPRVTSPVLGNGGVLRALTPRLFRQALAAVKLESGDEPPENMTAITNTWGSINVEEMYEGELRITETTKVAGIEIAAFQSVLGRVSVVDDPDAPYGKLFFTDFGEITRLVQRELSWRQEQGGGIFRPSDNALSWHANCLEICEYGIERRNRCAKIEDLREHKVTAFG